MEELYYVQDTRNYVGNSVLWWRHAGQGYTTNLEEAMLVTKDWIGRDTDKLWPVAKIVEISTRQVDMQLLRKIQL